VLAPDVLIIKCKGSAGFARMPHEKKMQETLLYKMGETVATRGNCREKPAAIPLSLSKGKAKLEQRLWGKREKCEKTVLVETHLL